MARKPRIHFTGAVYHAMARGVDKRSIFEDSWDRNVFLKRLERARTDAGASVIAYCLMGNHFHLLIKVSQIPLATIMQRLLTSYSRTYNWRHERTGHLFENRFRSIPCVTDSYLVALIRYIHLNPVRSKLVEHPREWPWSSYRNDEQGGRNGLVTLQSDVPPLDMELRPDFDPWLPPNEQVHGVLVRSEKVVPKPLADILAGSCGDLDSKSLTVRSKRRELVALRRTAIHAAVQQGHTLVAIAAALGVSPSTASRAIAESQIAKPDTSR